MSLRLKGQPVKQDSSGQLGSSSKERNLVAPGFEISFHPIFRRTRIASVGA
jgi:hypothetical protein